MNRHASRHDPTDPERALGFTILEMIVVLALLVIVAGFAAPFLSPDKFRMDAAVLEVSTALHSAQRKGVLRGHHVIVVFDTTGRRVTVHMDANNDGILQGSEGLTVLELEAGVTFGLGGGGPETQGLYGRQLQPSVGTPNPPIPPKRK